ncbi:hypothetical protein ACFOWE_31245 [Planomonospora corallina]|uniref:Uncharacterized protein n=1 Tax=Planomonospora corallina TaxID=1806052 RepID=A0ABV8IEY2_9ACTN
MSGASHPPAEAGVAAFVIARPAGDEVAVVYVPAGAAVRVHHPDGQTRDYMPNLPQAATYAAIPGDGQAIGWGAVPCWHPTVRSLRNQRHPLDRAAWHAAARAVGDGVVYVRYARREHHGRTRWTAIGHRPHLPAQQIGACA